ncbi:MAG: hypothetical protein Q4B50_05685, partial [Bacillota bacterium]|nr:hypothetical protein [Bacillota bacterium]
KAALAQGVLGHDAEGAVIRQAPVPEELADATVAQFVLDGMCGVQKQLPPASWNGKRGTPIWRCALCG